MANAYNLTIRNARMAVIVTEAGSSARIKCYNGTRPANGGALSGNTLIADLIAASTLGTVSDGALTLNAITDDSSADATGTPTFIRILKSDNSTWLADFDVSGFPGCVLGQPVRITSFALTEGNA